MYSLIRTWIGAKRGEDADPGEGRRQDDEGQREPVDAELVLDAEGRDPGELLDELEAGGVGVEARGEHQRDDPGHERGHRGASEPGPTDGATADHHRADERQEGDERQEDALWFIGSAAQDHEVRAGHRDQPEGDAERVVLDAARSGRGRGPCRSGGSARRCR